MVQTIHDQHHNHCKHANMKFCAACDKPYCADCGKEWNLYQPNWYYTTTTVTEPQITWTANTSDSATLTTSTAYHAHGGN